MTIFITRVHELAKVPVRGDNGSAGFDLSSIETTTIPSGQRRAIDTGIKIALPQGTYGRIAPRSGLALHYGIDVLAGVIDRSYRGVIKVILQNHGDEEYKIEAGDRIAQLIITKIDETSQFVETNSLDCTARGEGGFGSSGV